MGRIASLVAVALAGVLAWFAGAGSTWLSAHGAESPTVSIAARFTPPDKDGRSLLMVAATIKPGYHIYSITQPVQDFGPKPTTITLAPSEAYQLIGPFQADAPPKRKRHPELDNLLEEWHEGQVVWWAPIRWAANVDPARLKLSGTVRAQACTPTSCLPPQEYPFSAALGQDSAPPGSTPASSTPEPPQQQPPEATDERLPDFQPFDVIGDEQLKRASMLVAMGLGFLGGLILNLMPCVLPVIGLKIFAFMEQAGQSRRQALLLNVWYSAGLMAVFLVLAALTVALGLGWGEIFSFKGFSITMAAIVFAMGLSFLGVWEIPIPGFVGRGAASEVAEREGAVGAFAKGVLTTLLATPCSGPGLAFAVAWTANQPAPITFAVFTSMGLGMASPYLLIGAFPELLRFLPKPGPWMETFRQLMGFVLLGTVVFLLTFIQAQYVVPTVALMFGIWLACWWIGRTPATADGQTKIRAWLSAAVITGLVWLLAFGGLFARESELPWRPFTRQEFLNLIRSGRPVLVDFTADWCLTCKTLELLVLNTPRVRRAVEANNVVPLKADWTNGDKDVTEMLDRLGTRQVPTLAIFPADNPNKPIRLIGGYRIQTVVDALNQAGTRRSARM